MATITNLETGETREGHWYNWVRAHAAGLGVVKCVRVDETANGEADITITTATHELKEHWACYTVAKGYFGPPRGWRGSKVLKYAPKLFVDKDGEVEYDTVTGHASAVPPTKHEDAWYIEKYQGKWTVFYRSIAGDLPQSYWDYRDQADAAVMRLRAEVRK